MIVAVGSTNPTKTQPVGEVFEKHFQNVTVRGVKVDSGVGDQPLSDEEMFKGALNRAQKSLQKVKNATYGVGIEGGIHQYSYGWFERSLVVVIDRTGRIGIGSSGGLVLPPVVVKRIHGGERLEQVMDDLFKTEKIGQGIGMFGLMTRGVVTRASGVAHGVAFALAPFLHQKLYR